MSKNLRRPTIISKHEWHSLCATRVKYPEYRALEVLAPCLLPTDLPVMADHSTGWGYWWAQASVRRGKQTRVMEGSRLLLSGCN